jgi:hypothetical protein
MAIDYVWSYYVKKLSGTKSPVSWPMSLYYNYRGLHGPAFLPCNAPVMIWAINIRLTGRPPAGELKWNWSPVSITKETGAFFSRFTFACCIMAAVVAASFGRTDQTFWHPGSPSACNQRWSAGFPQSSQVRAGPGQAGRGPPVYI